MVFAPKESVESIGWEERENLKSATKKKPRELERRASSSTKRKSNESSSGSGSGSGETPNQKKRSKDGPSSDDSNSIANDGTSQMISESARSLVESDYYGPQLPPSQSDDINQVPSSMNMNILPPGVSQIQMHDSPTLATMITFEDETSTLAIVGRAKLKAIEGSVEILGFRLLSSSDDTTCREQKEVVVESPDWMSCLCIEPIIDKSRGEGAKVKIQISSLDDEDDDEGKGEATFELLSPQLSKPISMDAKWRNIASNIVNSLSSEKSTTTANNGESSANDGANKVLVCGAKGVGKSTYVRYLANCYLSQNPGKEVAILDCDVGQPELSPPGMLTLTILSKPLLSPPHAHMVCNHRDIFSVAERHQKAYYYGGTTSKNNPVMYVTAIGKLIKEYETLCQSQSQSQSTSPMIPLIVNTDGYVKSMGYEILSSLIDIINPNHIAQIVGTSKAKFFDLTPHARPDRIIHIAETKGTFPTSQNVTPTISRVTSLSSMPSMNDLVSANFSADKGGGVESISPIVSSLLRDLRICVYFLGGYESFLGTKSSFHKGGINDDDCNIAMKLAAMKPYAVPFEAIQCILLDEDGNRCKKGSREEMYQQLNASIIGLCDKFNSCHGLGIVRGVDNVRKILYILTPTHPDILRTHVVSAVRGQLQLPLACTYRGVYTESFPFLCCDGVSVGIGSETMKGKDR